MKQKALRKSKDKPFENITKKIQLNNCNFHKSFNVYLQELNVTLLLIVTSTVHFHGTI